MYDMYRVILILCFTVVMSLVLTEIVRHMAFKIGAVDEPNSRRINKKTMPTSGGLAIYISYFISILFILPLEKSLTLPIFIGATVILITGLIDDTKGLSPKLKMLGILLATIVIYSVGEIQMTKIGIPGVGLIELGYLSFPMTFLWIAAITNSINLIDGLDGLASGVSSISLTTIGIFAYFFLSSQNNVEVTIMVFALVAAILGFLPANYNPAKIYLGDTGALFLGFMISVFSLLNLKNVTFISLIVPLVILGVPIADTLFAIIRRLTSKQPISMADNQHIHHRLMAAGFSHKDSVKLLYALTAIFSYLALLYPVASNVGTVLLTVGLILSILFIAELLGLLSEEKKPLTNIFKKLLFIFTKDFRK